MMYLLQFTTKKEITDILKELDKIKMETSDFIKYDVLEKYLVKVLQENKFKPNPAEEYLAAFKVLDPKDEGFIRKTVFQELISTYDDDAKNHDK